MTWLIFQFSLIIGPDKNMKKAIIFFVLFISTLLFLSIPAKAADFLFNSEVIEIQKNNEIKIDFFVSAEQNPINAISGQLIIPTEYISVKEILIGESGINLWIEKPELKNNIIDFSGIVPNGFTGKINIFSLIIKAENIGNIQINSSNLRALLNNGIGTDDNVSASKLAIDIIPETAEFPTVIQLDDAEPPDFFQIEIVKNNFLFDGKYAVIFHTEDKQSGVNHYKILEQREYDFFGIKYRLGQWKTASSPYLLKDQKLKSLIQVVAIDNLGNERDSILPATNPIKWYENIVFWSIILITLIFGMIFCIYVKRRVKK